MLESARMTACGLEEVELEYEFVLRHLYQAIDALDRGFMQRARAWAAARPKTDVCPSLQDFVDSVLLEGGEFQADAMTAGYRFMCAEEQDPYGQIAILSRYSRTPVPGCYFTFSWHSEMAEREREDELRTIADDFYFCLKQLAPAAAEALARDRLRYNLPARIESAIAMRTRGVSQALESGSMASRG
jgi:hypothetical protein